MQNPRTLKYITSAIFLFLLVAFSNRTPLLAQQSTCPTGISTDRTLANRPYRAGDLLLETDTYQLYALDTGTCWCSVYGGTQLVLIFKGGEDYIVTNDVNYWRRLEKEIIPAVSSRCEQWNNVSVRNHIRGFYLTDSDGRIVDRSDIESFLNNGEKSKNFSFASRKIHKDGKEYIWDGDDLSIAWKRKRINGQVTADQEAKRQKEFGLTLQRLNAADILALLERSSAKNAPVSYDFTGSKEKDGLTGIYSGDFKPFTKGYETSKDAEDVDTALNRHQIRLAYVAYHRAFEEVCRPNNEFDWMEVTFRWTKGFDEQVVKYLVRAPFAGAFRRAFLKAETEDSIGSWFKSLSEITYQNYKSDFRKFLSTENCSSPAVRQFEVNLYLANEWFLPLQVLYEPSKTDNQRLGSESNKSDLEKAKPAPAPQRPKPKTRKPRHKASTR